MKSTVLMFAVLLIAMPLLAQEMTLEKQLELQSVQQQIKENNLNWIAAPNHVALMEGDSWLDMCGTPVDADYAPPTNLPHRSRDLPVSLDWRDNGGNWITPVRNQGSCGSCWDFATVAGFEGYQMISSGEPNQTSINFSEQHILSCGANSTGCDGGQMTQALDFIVNNGICDEYCFPYYADDTRLCSEACDDIEERLTFLGDWKTITYSSVNVAEINEALQYGPLITSYMVYENFNWYSSGVYSAYGSTPTGTGHAVLIVGYDDDLQAWLVKNSWGSWWADLGGYFWIAYDSGCGFGATTYQCRPYNHPPEFSDVVATPETGGAYDTFTWEVVYTDADGDMPETHNLSLRNPVTGVFESFAMSSTDTDPTDGALYTLSMQLIDQGTYQYRFSFVNSYDQSLVWPTTPLSGPEVGPQVNHEPELTDYQVVTTGGNTFTFSVTYTDQENEAPAFMHALMLLPPDGGDQQTIAMETDDTDFTDGALYLTDVSLEAEGVWQHRYIFLNSNSQLVRIPEDANAWIEGPSNFGGNSSVPGIGVTKLFHPMPNPANPGTTIRFELAETGPADLSIYDVTGRKIRTLLNSTQPSGPGSVFWDGKDDSGRTGSSGIYFVRLSAGDEVRTNRLQLVK